MTPATAERYGKYLIQKKKDDLHSKFQELQHHASFHGLNMEIPDVIKEDQQPGTCDDRQKEKCETQHKGFLSWVCEHCDARP